MNYLELIIGGIVGWFVTRFFIFFSKASLSFEIDNGQVFQVFQPDENKYKFLSIVIKNKPKNLFYRIRNILLGTVSLDNAKAQIKFMTLTKPRILIKPINNARWATTKEPIDYATSNIDFSQILIPSRESIFPEEESVINIAIKKEGDLNFYGFNNESYDNRWWPLNPKFQIAEKYCHVKLEILSMGKTYIYEFSLLNTNNKLDEFLLRTY